LTRPVAWDGSAGGGATRPPRSAADMAQRLQDQSDSLAAACGPAVDADIGGRAREFGLRSGQRQ